MFAPRVNTYVDGEISRVVIKLQELETDSNEYGALLERLGKLHKLRQDEKPDTASTDTLVTSAVSLIGILMILHHEELHPITSRALSFIRLGR